MTVPSRAFSWRASLVLTFALVVLPLQGRAVLGWAGGQAGVSPERRFEVKWNAPARSCCPHSIHLALLAHLRRT